MSTTANDVTITVRDRDLTDPDKIRARWKTAQRGMADDAEKSSRTSGGKSGKSWLSGFGQSLGGEGGGGIAAKVQKSFVGMFALTAKTAATAFSAQFVGSVVAGLASGAAKLAHGLGAMVALLPAAAVAGVTAMAALKLAVVGVGDALTAAVTGDAKEFDEAIKGLAPSARGFAREVRGMRTEITGLQQGVQQSFFEKFAGDTKKLGGTYLPMVRSALSGIAGSFGKAAHESAGFLASSKTSGVLAMTLGHVRAAVSNVAGALPSLVRAFVPLVAVGSTFLPKLTAGLKHGADELARMADAGQKSGGIARFIQGGIDKLKSLWETAKQVGRVIGNVFDIFSNFNPAGGVFAALGIQTGGLLDSLEALTGKAKAFFETAAGGQAITEIFGIIQSLLSATMGTLAHVATMLGRVFAPLLPQLSKFAEATAGFQLALADGLEPALQAVADAIKIILPPATTLLNLMSSNKTVMAGLAGVVTGLWVAWKVGAVAAKVAQSSFNITAGGAAAAVGALSMALIQMNSAQRAKDMANMVEGFIAADGAITTQTRSILYLNQVTGRQDEFVRSLIDSNPRLAQSLIDNASAYGISADDAAAYQTQLDQTTAATENATDALTRQKDALRGMTDPVFAAIDAQSRLADAQAHLAEVQADGSATAADVTRAHEDVAKASADVTGSMYDLAIAMQNGDTLLGQVLGSLKRQVKQGDLTRAGYNSMALTAAAAFGSIKDRVNAIPKSRTTQVKAKDGASGVISNVASRLGWLNGRSATVNIGANIGRYVGQLLAGGFAHGGITGSAAGGGPRSGGTWVGEHGRELVDLPPGSRVHSNPDSERMAAAGGGRGPVVFEFRSDGTPLMDLLMELFRKAIQASHGGDVQAALGWRN